MERSIKNGRVWTYNKTIAKYNNILSTSSVGSITELLDKHGDKLNHLEFNILKMRLAGHSLESIGNEFKLTRERIREREGYALQLLKFYSLPNQSYTKEQIINMNVSDFINLIPPNRNYSNTALRNVLLKNFKNHKVSYLVDNFRKLVNCYDMGNRCYETLRGLLVSYNVDMPDVAVFNSLKYRRRKRVR